jgi:hypothetical protein
MAYQGISPYLYNNNLTNVQLLDDISGSFNGTTTQFNLTVNGSVFHAVSSRSLLIILGGIVQEPDVDYTVSTGVITFTTAPVSGLTFAARNIYGLNRLTGINDGLVTPASLSLGGPSWNTDGDLILSGDANNVYVNTDTPTIRPTLDLNFERDRRLDSRITYSRSSTATYLGFDGLIKTAQINEPRFDYDRNGNSLGFLIEESRSNIGLYSEDFSQWTIDGVTVSTDQTTAPDGTITADLITGTSGNRRIYRIAVSSSGPVYTYSIFLKKNVGSTIRFDNINIGSTSTEFNFDTGVLTLQGTSFSSGTVVSYPNGWYRLTFTFTSNAASSSLGPYFVNANDSCYMWGYQFELGAFATSYIPTVASAVTRSADTASMTGNNFSDWYNQTEGTIFSQHSLIDGVDNNNNCYVYQVDNGTNDGVAFRLIDKNTFYSNPSKLTATTLNSGSSVTLLQKSSVSSGTTLHSTSYAVKTDDFAVTFDGATVQTDDSGTLPNNQTTLSIGYNAPANTAQLNGHIKRLTYYPQRLSNSQLQNLTS